MSRRLSRVRGFTLVELLVVIGIIALLISILLPALGAARRQATKTKCAAQMRDLGSAILMYVQDYKGYLPSVRMGPNNLPNGYTIDGIRYQWSATDVPGQVVGENAKWWHFIGKYLSKQRTMAQTGDDMTRLTASIFWCPSFSGYPDAGKASNLIGGINRNLPGIGMNDWPVFRPDYPLPGVDFPPAAERFWDPTAPGATRGKWYKLIHYTQPGDRALLADSRQFYIQSRAVAAGSDIPGQPLHISSPDYSLVGQTTFDFYRHGQYPGVASPSPAPGYYKNTGGKIGYNILYADNHVASPTDRETAYRATRMRFPG